MGIREAFRRVISGFRKDEAEKQKTLAASVAALAIDDGSQGVKEIQAVVKEHGIPPDALEEMTVAEQERMRLRAVYAELPALKAEYARTGASIAAIQKQLHDDVATLKATAKGKITDELAKQAACQAKINACETAGVKLLQSNPRRAEVMKTHGNKSNVVWAMNEAAAVERRAQAGANAAERELMAFRKQAEIECKESAMVGRARKPYAGTAAKIKEAEASLATQQGTMIEARKKREAAQQELEASRAAILKFEREAVGAA